MRAMAIHQKKTVLIKNNPVCNNRLELLLSKPGSAGMQINIFNREDKLVLLTDGKKVSFEDTSNEFFPGTSLC